MFANRIGGHIFPDFITNNIIIGLVHLDDFFDMPVDFIGKQFLDVHRLPPLKNFGPVVMFRIQNAHET